MPRLAQTAATVLVATVLSIGGVSSASAATEVMISDGVLFSRGEAGYFCFRIPTLVKADNGDVLAIAEGRMASCADDAAIDLVLKRSTDGGVTWSSVQKIADGGGNTLGNPVPVVDEVTGRIAILANRNQRGGCAPCDRDVYLVYSDDDGLSWSTPQEQPQLKRPEWDRFIANGPVHGIQLTRGEHAGRLIVSASHEMSDGDALPIFGSHLYYSDDGGLTWTIGAVIADREGRTKPTETTVVELTDGRVYVNAREVASASDGYRAWATSSDSGESFDGYFQMLPEISTTTVQASLLRLTATDEGDDRNRILFSTTAHPGAREVMAIRSSYDETRTWESWEAGKVVWWGPTAYSDLVEIGAATSTGIVAGLLYEAGVVSPYETIRFARFNEAYLDSPNGTPDGFPPPPEPGPTTPDSSPRYDNAAYVRGGAGLAAGRFGEGLSLDGVDDHVQIPYTPAVDLSDGDFTVMTWFRYDATSGSHSLAWAYRMNAAPQLWLRAEPGSNRIRASIGTGQGSATLASAGAYNDGAWHHVAIQRAAGQFVMIIDGAQVAADTAPPGSVTNGREFGVDGMYVGQRLDGGDRFGGSLDEFRVYARALSDAELDRVRIDNVPIAGQLRLRLPFETIDRQ